jgi:hypothetical protein
MPHTLRDLLFATRERPQDLPFVLCALVFPDAQQDRSGPAPLGHDQRRARSLHAPEHTRGAVSQIGDGHALGAAGHCYARTLLRCICWALSTTCEVMLTISSTVASFCMAATGLDRPSRIGPTAEAPAIARAIW